MALPLSSRNSDVNNYAEINRLIKKVEGKDRVKIFKDDAGDRRVLLGKGKNNFYGLRVSKDGYDVYDAADSELVFNSSQNVFKIVASSTYTLTKPASQITAEATVAHGLSFIPILLFNIESASTSPGEWRLGLVMNHNTTTGILNSIASVSVDATNIKFRAQTPSGGSLYASELVFNYKYYLLQETAN